MKALTLTQPWATLVAIGAKKIETRSWSTQYRGPLAIHAAKLFPKSARELYKTEPFESTLMLYIRMYKASRLNLFHFVLPVGCMIATCELVAIFMIEKRHRLLPTFSQPLYLPPVEPELSFGDYTPGRYAWILGNIKPLSEPIPVKGKLGLWEWVEEKGATP